MIRQPAPRVTTYPPRSVMHPALHKRFVGLDVDGHDVSGVIWHIGKYDKVTGKPATYVVQLDPNGSAGDHTAIVSADVIHEHLRGLDLLSSMEADNE